MSLFTNIHKIASTLIPRSTIEWRKGDVERVISESGVAYAKHQPWVKCRAHVQPGVVSSFGGRCISEKDYKDMGLDWSKKYWTVWVSDQNITSIAGVTTSDQIKYKDKVCNVLQVADWEEFDGWKRLFISEMISK